MKKKKLTALLLAAALLLALCSCSRFNPSSDGTFGNGGGSSSHTSPSTGDKPTESPSASPSAPELESEPISYYGVSLRLPKGFAVADEQDTIVFALTDTPGENVISVALNSDMAYSENEGSVAFAGAVEYRYIGGVEAAVVRRTEPLDDNGGTVTYKEVWLFLKTKTVLVLYTGSFDGCDAAFDASAETIRVDDEEIPDVLALATPEALAAAGLDATPCIFGGYCMNLPQGYTVNVLGPEMTIAEAPNGRDSVTFQAADEAVRDTSRDDFDRTLRESIPGYNGITDFQKGKLNDALDATYLSFGAEISGEAATVTQFWLFGVNRDPALLTVTQFSDDTAMGAAIDTIRPALPQSVSLPEDADAPEGGSPLSEEAHSFSGVLITLPRGMVVTETLLGELGEMAAGGGPTFAFAVLPPETDRTPERVASFYARFDGFEALASNDDVQLGATPGSVSSAAVTDGTVVMALVYFPDRCVQIIGRDTTPDLLRACFDTLDIG